ncbi:hypothetical protein Btru_052156 [Bulinus truncatus]|nr:hypothetical protein Btru_052156 [Bulinus truncatus]
MFQMADEFFQSLGLIPMPYEFWNKSMFEQPTDNRSVVCHATSWDFHNGKDFRILMCADVNDLNLQTIHHEMGHIQYFLQYADKPISFRQGANPAFHEAVGELILLSVKTPEHMHSIGLLKTLNNDTEYDINFLMSMALKNIGLLPFAYLTDQWRWKVFRGDVTPDEYNKEWWNLKCRYQGFFPPVERTSEDFDPGHVFHISSNFPYVRYFLSYIIQFQFHKALCQEIGYTGPLHRCDIYNSTVAGRKLSDMLKLGSSVHWREVMRNLTGQDKMLAEPLLEYFKPLTNYLKRVNCDDYGWKDQCPQ